MGLTPKRSRRVGRGWPWQRPAGRCANGPRTPRPRRCRPAGAGGPAVGAHRSAKPPTASRSPSSPGPPLTPISSARASPTAASDQPPPIDVYRPGARAVRAPGRLDSGRRSMRGPGGPSTDCHCARRGRPTR